MEPPPPKIQTGCRPMPGSIGIANSNDIKDTSSSSSACSSSWSISEESLRRYVCFASESCIQDLLAASTIDDHDDIGAWKLLTTLHNGVEVEVSKRRRRRSSGSSSSAAAHHHNHHRHVFRSRWHLPSISPHQFISVANAIDAAKQWDSDLVEGRYIIKDLEKNLSIVRLRFGPNSKFVFRKREFIVYERRETMSDGTLVVAVASLPKEIAAGLQPKRHNSLRGLLLQSGWVVEKQRQDDDSSCIVTYVVQLDPAGWLPRYFANRLGTKLVMIVDNLQKQAQQQQN